ncbi:MAG: NAD(P)-dependent oxidoreductase [Cyanobacteria bacterium SBLK]|nr:NAD(P)-dependent oxidoreductase [Cyanobacteria bacterium SBLK]
MTQSSTVLVTGATGFIGKNLVAALIHKGYEVHALVRPTSDARDLQLLDKQIKLHSHKGSTEQLLDIFARVKPDLVFHLASLFVAEHRSSQVQDLIQSNILFGTQLLESMVENGVSKLINTGTSWQHYNINIEDSIYNPVCLYAATKQAFEAIIKYYSEAKGIHVMTLKLSDTYGPGDKRKKLFYHLKKAAIEGKPLKMSLGEQFLDLVYIDDAIDAFLQAAVLVDSELVKKVNCNFSVTSGNLVKLKNIIALYNKLSPKKVLVEWGGRPYRQREVMIPWIGKSLPSWKAKVSLEEGLSKILN